jgi:hypothetical protein
VSLDVTPDLLASAERGELAAARGSGDPGRTRETVLRVGAEVAPAVTMKTPS